MSASLSTIKRLAIAAIRAVDGPQGVRGPLRGKDFMQADLTTGADRDGR